MSDKVKRYDSGHVNGWCMVLRDDGEYVAYRAYARLAERVKELEKRLSAAAKFIADLEDQITAKDKRVEELGKDYENSRLWWDSLSDKKDKRIKELEAENERLRHLVKSWETDID